MGWPCAVMSPRQWPTSRTAVVGSIFEEWAVFLVCVNPMDVLTTGADVAVAAYAAAHLRACGWYVEEVETQREAGEAGRFVFKFVCQRNISNGDSQRVDAHSASQQMPWTAWEPIRQTAPSAQTVSAATRTQRKRRLALGGV